MTTGIDQIQQRIADQIQASHERCAAATESIRLTAAVVVLSGEIIAGNRDQIARMDDRRAGVVQQGAGFASAAFLGLARSRGPKIVPHQGAGERPKASPMRARFGWHVTN